MTPPPGEAPRSITLMESPLGSAPRSRFPGYSPMGNLPPAHRAQPWAGSPEPLPMAVVLGSSTWLLPGGPSDGGPGAGHGVMSLDGSIRPPRPSWRPMSPFPETPSCKGPPLGAGTWERRESRGDARATIDREGHEGQGCREATPADQEGKPL